MSDWVGYWKGELGTVIERHPSSKTVHDLLNNFKKIMYDLKIVPDYYLKGSLNLENKK